MPTTCIFLPFYRRWPDVLRWLIAAMLLAFFALQARADSLAPSALELHINQSETSAHFDLQLSSSLPVHTFLVDGPPRLIIDLPEINFMAKEPRFSGGEGVITSFRYGLFAPGQSRIVMNLTGPVRLISAEVVPELDSAKTARLMVNLEKSDASAFQASIQASQATPAAASTAADHDQGPDARAGDDKRPLIVIDPGHGGPDSGATGVDGVVEKNVVFGFAQTLKAQLEATGRYRVLLTRAQDIFVPLAERTRIARAANASLFISVHADTLSDIGSVSGATVYTVSERASDAEAARVAAHENAADIAGGLTPSEQQPEVADILFDLTRRETRAFAHLFSRSLVAAWKSVASLNLNKNPQRSAGFVVLKAPDVPSVLLELGYLSSPKDAKDLVSQEWRDRAAGSVTAAVNTYFSRTQAK